MGRLSLKRRKSSVPTPKPVSFSGKNFPSLMQKRIAFYGKYSLPVPPSLRNDIANRLKYLIFSVAFLWPSLCITAGHELLPRISVLPIKRVVLADRLPVGNVPTVEHPVHSAHFETGEGAFRTRPWGYDPSGSPVRIAWERSLYGREGMR